MGLDENKNIYLNSPENGRDSAYAIGGKFKFDKLNIVKKGIYFIKLKYKLGRYDFPLFLTENSVLQFDVNRDFSGYIISGDKNALEQNDFYQGRISLYNKMKLIEKEILATNDSNKLFKLKSEKHKLSNLINEYVPRWVIEHKSSPFSVAVVRLYMAKNPNSGTEDTLAEKYYDQLLPAAKKNNSEVAILETGFSYYNSKYSRLEEGRTLPNFILRDTSGNEILFEDFSNKYMLIDFWASWCGPCRANNPLLKELYFNFKEKGLVILSVSLDKDANKWRDAIKKDDMQWLQGSDLKGQYGGLGAKYRIGAVPIYILVNPERKIILKSIGGDVDLVREKLDEIFR